MRQFYLGLSVCALMFVLSTPQLDASITTFFGENLTPGGAVSGDPLTARTAFLSNLSGVGNEDFEGFSLGTSNPTLTFAGSVGSITANLSGSSAVDTAGSGRFATSGSQFLDTNSGFTLDFSTGISAFGFYGTDIGDFGGEITLTLDGGGTQMLNLGNSLSAPNGALLFYGFIDDTNSYTSIECWEYQLK